MLVELFRATSKTRLAPRLKEPRKWTQPRGAVLVERDDLLSLLARRVDGDAGAEPAALLGLLGDEAHHDVLNANLGSTKRHAAASITALMARSVNFSNTAVTTSAPRAWSRGARGGRGGQRTPSEFKS